VVLFAARAASASPSYPGALKTDLGLPNAPSCTVCHEAATDPVGPADTLFAKAMEARGLVGNDDVASLAAAIKKMEADNVDSDGDGAEDLDELYWGGDPNHADLPVGGAQMQARFGCAWSGSHLARGEGRLPTVGALGFLAVLAMRRRRRARA
jgi:cytochrome c551/c552